MQYLMLIYANEAESNDRSPEELATELNGYLAFDKTLREGQILGGEALYPITTATTVRIRDGKRTVTDGPFAETREQLGGFYLIDAVDLDEAIEIAARIPTVKRGSVEIRPIQKYDLG